MPAGTLWEIDVLLQTVASSFGYNEARVPSRLENQIRVRYRKVLLVADYDILRDGQLTMRSTGTAPKAEAYFPEEVIFHPPKLDYLLYGQR